MGKDRKYRLFLLIGLLDVLIIGFGTLATAGQFSFVEKGYVWLAFSMGIVALLTFWAMLAIGYNKVGDHPWQESYLRTAIAVSLIAVYLAIVGTVAFYKPTEGAINLHPMTQQIINSFTTVVGIVIAFFFGSSAYIEAKKRSSGEQKGSSKTE